MQKGFLFPKIKLIPIDTIVTVPTQPDKKWVSLKDSLKEINLGSYQRGFLHSRTLDTLVKPVYDFTHYINDDSVIVAMKKVLDKPTYCIVNIYNGEEILLPKYNLMQNFSEGLAAVRYNGEWGFINQHGEVAVDFQYVGIEGLFETGRIKVNKGGKWVWQGKKKRSKKLVLQGGEWFYINRDGNRIN